LSCLGIVSFLLPPLRSGGMLIVSASKLCDKGILDTRLSLPHVKGVSGSDMSKLVSQPPFPSLISTETAPSSEPSLSKPKDSFTDFASSIGEVSAFARAVISNIVPIEFWGSEENKKGFMRNVDRFVKLRRYETLSLHEVMQGMKVGSSSSVYQGVD